MSVILFDRDICYTCQEEIIDDINDKLVQVIDSLKVARTSRLWIQYMEMIDILRKSLKAERTGDWKLHLASVCEMLPYVAAAGHNLYAKSAYLYLQLMLELQTMFPDIYEKFIAGFHVIRRSNRYWAGLSSDLVIEQVLMKNRRGLAHRATGRKPGGPPRRGAPIKRAVNFLTSLIYLGITNSYSIRKAKDIFIFVSL